MAANRVSVKLNKFQAQLLYKRKLSGAQVRFVAMSAAVHLGVQKSSLKLDGVLFPRAAFASAEAAAS